MLICLFPSMDFYALHTFRPTLSSLLSLLSMILDGKGKGKASRYRPGVAQRVPGS